jgi:hypothetical protein
MGIRSRTNESKIWTTLLLALLAVGCAVKTATFPTATPSPGPAFTPSPLPGPFSTSEAMASDVAGRLVVRRVTAPPVIDGQVEAVWEMAESLQLSLTRGRDIHLDLRALWANETIYFLAQWLGGSPSGEENTLFNTLTIHWRIPDAEARRLDCAVACHTAFADGQGRFVFANAETIPQGGGEALPLAGSWRAGTWTLEWSRSLVNGNPFDLQFDDLDEGYLFSVKVFERIQGQPDAVSPLHRLVFEN